MDWDSEQIDVIMEESSAWQCVEAGPGAGKSAVACQRVAFLIEEGVAPDRIHIVSFTRAAVAEIRDRIVNLGIAGEDAKSIRISTLDSQAWTLRTGFDEAASKTKFSTINHELNIEAAITLFKTKNEELLDYLAQLEHLVLDEAQDVLGARALLVMEILKSLSENCGVTILADPKQGIYGFTNDEGAVEHASKSLLDIIKNHSPRSFVERRLHKNHRVKVPNLVRLFSESRQQLEAKVSSREAVDLVKAKIAEHSNEYHPGVNYYEDVVEVARSAIGESVLVLFRRRADVVAASSYFSAAAVDHRIRLGSNPVIIKPWIGWVLGRSSGNLISESEFYSLWSEQAKLCEKPLNGESKENSWQLIKSIAASKHPGAVSLSLLRSILARATPPLEFCLPDVGSHGPVLSTIHAAKGREADTVILAIPESLKWRADSADEASLFEESRVYYVGATRAKMKLIVTSQGVPRAFYLKSKRVGRFVNAQRNVCQLEIGRDGDVDVKAHLRWPGAILVQNILAQNSFGSKIVCLRDEPSANWAARIFLEEKSGPNEVTKILEIGQMSDWYKKDIKEVWSKFEDSQAIRPSGKVSNLYLVGATSVILTNDEISSTRGLVNNSGFYLAPVIKGFPSIYFIPR